MMREKRTEKIIVLGVDGMDPMLSKKFMDQGKMPNLAKFVAAGSARKDLVLLGAMPTVTPPMWTTLATGAYPATHGITAFFNQHPQKLDTRLYALDSRMCKAEPLWNVFAESGVKTLVWHWPGSSWPPTSQSPNLAVVDGTQPTSINMGVAIIDWETVELAGEDINDLQYMAYDAVNNNGAGCVITGLEDMVAGENEGSASKGADKMKKILEGGRENVTFVIDESDTEIATLGNVNFNVINSPIKAASGWAAAPEGAKEFIMLTSGGFVRRPCLILPNENGVYDRVAVYKSKKDAEPLLVVENDVFTPNFVDEVITNNETKMANRNVRIFELAPDGSKIRFWLSPAYDLAKDDIWHPKALFQEIKDNIGLIPPTSMATGKNPEYAEKLLVASFDYYCQWQADCLKYLMKQYPVIFSHLHNIDAIGHQIWHYAKTNDQWGNDEVFYQKLIEDTYVQTDKYLGEFLPYLEEDWTILITSDHGLITEENHPPGLGEGGVNGTVMAELGYTVFKKDEQGNILRQLDWSQTKAIASRGGHIYLNLKGRYATGIVEPEDQYELEAQIISDLYNYRDAHTNKRVVAMALRNKDAAILGLDGPESGDIIFFMEEGFNIIHMDSLSTQSGYFDTSVSPIFVAAGKGIKANYTIERMIRQVDFAPTMAVLGGVDMPAQCEGAPMYQIFTEKF